MRRTLIVGEAPGRTAENSTHVPLYFYPSNSAGARLCRMTGLGRQEYLRAFERINILPYFPGASWRLKDQILAASIATQLMMGGLMANRHVVVLGRHAWRALGGRGDVEPFHWYTGPSYIPGRRPRPLLAYFPHPSGRNRVWNEPGVKECAEEFLAALVQLAVNEGHTDVEGQPSREGDTDPEVPDQDGQGSEG